MARYRRRRPTWKDTDIERNIIYDTGDPRGNRPPKKSFIVRIRRLLVDYWMWVVPAKSNFIPVNQFYAEHNQQVVEGLQNLGWGSVTYIIDDMWDSDYFFDPADFEEIFDGFIPLLTQGKNEEALRFFVKTIREFADDPSHLGHAHWEDEDDARDNFLHFEDWDDLEKSQDVYLLPLAKLEEELGC